MKSSQKRHGWTDEWIVCLLQGWNKVKVAISLTKRIHFEVFISHQWILDSGLIFMLYQTQKISIITSMPSWFLLDQQNPVSIYAKENPIQ